MRSFLLVLASALLTFPAAAESLSILQETSVSAQIQTVQATGYWGSWQPSFDANWTLGLDWNHVVNVRGGLSGRSVQTSPVVEYTVYPGYLGWGWVAALDWLPFLLNENGAVWTAGFNVSGRWEFLSYP